MADLNINLKDSREIQEIKNINGSTVSTKLDAIKLLERLKELGGDLYKESNLLSSIENNFFESKLDIYTLESVIGALEKQEENNKKEEEESPKEEIIEPEKEEEELVSNVDIRELVDEYEEYLKKGLNEQESRDKIFKNFPNTNQENVERYIKRQQEIYNQSLEKIRQEEIKNENKITTESKIIDKEKIAKIVTEELLVKEEELINKIGEEKAKIITNEIIEEVIAPYIVNKTEIEEDKFNKYLLDDSDKKDLNDTFELIDAKIKVEDKIEILSEQIIENFKKDERFEDKIELDKEKIENVLREEIKLNLEEEIVLTDNEKSDRLAEKITKAVQRAPDIELEQELTTTIRTESFKIEKNALDWIKNNNVQLSVIKGQIIEDKIQQTIFNENNNITAEQRVNIQEYGKIVKSVYSKISIIDANKEELIVNIGAQGINRDNASNSWIDLKGLTHVVQMKPNEFDEFVGRYKQIKNGMGNIRLPFNIKESRSLDKIVRLADNPTIKSLINQSQRYIGTFEKISNFTSGRVFYNKAGKFLVDKIGNQAVKSFAENSLGIIAKEGMEKGIATILKGILSGGVRAGVTMGAEAAATGGAIAAAGGAATVPIVGWLVAAGIAILEVGKKVLKKGEEIAKNLGIDMGIKGFLQDTFGKFFGGIADFGLKVGSALLATNLIGGAISAATTIIGPVVICVIVGLFAYQMMFSSQTSSLVSTTTEETIVSSEYDAASVRQLGFNFVVPTITTQFSRADLVSVATSVIGLPYFWGGKYPHKGVNPNWGTLTKVSADGSWSTGIAIPLGLDCSGFVDWVYYQLTERQVSNGGGSASICSYASPVSRSELKPGDVGCMDGHISLYIGKDETDGEGLFIQAVGRSYRDNASGKVAGQVLILKEGKAYNGFTGPTFTSYARPHVTFTDN